MRLVSGHPDMFNHIAFGMPNQRMANFLESQFTNLGPVLNEAGQAFIDKSKQVFERFQGSEAMRLAKAAMRTVQHMFDPDTVRYLDNVSALQQARPAMQRWIMASPEVREWYHKQRCDGYSITYLDEHPGDVGVNHTDWRIVNSGVIKELPDDHESGADWMFTNYYFDDVDTKLTLGEKVDIMSTWDVIKTMLKPGGEDPTSPYADRL
jgi:anaerobic ribonucleoside-triphosphate reductase